MNFPNESHDYRAARDQPLAKEAEERRMMEEVAIARRALPEGGLPKEDYLLQEVESVRFDSRGSSLELGEQLSHQG